MRADMPASPAGQPLGASHAEQSRHLPRTAARMQQAPPAKWRPPGRALRRRGKAAAPAMGSTSREHDRSRGGLRRLESERERRMGETRRVVRITLLPLSLRALSPPPASNNNARPGCARRGHEMRGGNSRPNLPRPVTAPALTLGRPPPPQTSAARGATPGVRPDESSRRCRCYDRHRR